MSALWVASGMGHLALGEYLLSEGADSCFVSKKCSGFSCLGNACGSSNLKFVTLLLWAGADPDVLSDVRIANYVTSFEINIAAFYCSNSVRLALI